MYGGASLKRPPAPKALMPEAVFVAPAPRAGAALTHGTRPLPQS
jgi:hypothetical protein